jgi:Kef-type K+ transport system membrane component KefB
MNRATKRGWIGQSAWAMVVIVAIALILILSIAITLDTGHSFDRTTLALPVLFVFLFLPTAIGDWLDIEDFVAAPKPRFSPSLSRGPPA